MAWEACQISSVVAVKRRRALIVERSCAIILIDHLPSHLLRRPLTTGLCPLTGFRMEGSTIEAMSCCPYLSTDNFPPLVTCSLSSSIHRPLLLRIAIIQEMGRRSWATPEQLEFLKTFIPLLPRAKGTTGLKTLYAQVHEGFLEKWPNLEPVLPEPGSPIQDPVVLARKKLLDVRAKPHHLCSCAYDLPAHLQLV